MGQDAVSQAWVSSHGMRCNSPIGSDSAVGLVTALSLCVQVKLLVEEGGADVWVRDRWGKTAYDEARRVGATAVAEYLKQIMDRCCFVQGQFRVSQER